MWGGYGGGKKYYPAKSDEKIVCSQNWQKNRIVCMGKQSLLVPLPERENKFVSGYRSEKKSLQRGKNHTPPHTHVSSGPPPTV